MIESPAIKGPEWYADSRWSDVSGLVLSDIRHQHRIMAREIKITRIYLYFKNKKGEEICQDLQLGSSPFEFKKKPSLLAEYKPFEIDPETWNRLLIEEGTGGPSEPVKFDDTLSLPYTVPFTVYHPIQGISAIVENKSKIIENNFQKIQLEQKYLFTAYNSSPSHEPSGSLRAARLYPLLEFKYSSSKEQLSKDDTIYFLTGIRADYRLHFTLEDNPKKIWKKHDYYMNQPALFADTESELPESLGRFGQVVASVTSENRMDQVFRNAEKPLVYETFVTGVDRGNRGEYDNLHFWPYQPYNEEMKGEPENDKKQKTNSGIVEVRRRYGETEITPGAFHCIHSHWRWTSLAPKGIKYNDVTRVAIDKAWPGGAHFAGQHTPGYPLLDPDIPRQTIQLAVVTEDTAIEIDKHPPAKNFKDYILQGLNSIPGRINNFGESIVIYKSFFVDITKPVDKGTIFVHGLYFAHEEQLSHDFGALGAELPVYITYTGGTSIRSSISRHNRIPRTWENRGYRQAPSSLK